MFHFYIEAEKCIKSMVFKVDEKLVVVLVRGDHEVNDVKVKNVYGQVLVYHDLISYGVNRVPKFVKQYTSVQE
ncbi:YbaK/EbsC family protein, partial [Bacillus sp. D-CC]